MAVPGTVDSSASYSRDIYKIPGVFYHRRYYMGGITREIFACLYYRECIARGVYYYRGYVRRGKKTRSRLRALLMSYFADWREVNK